MSALSLYKIIPVLFAGPPVQLSVSSNAGGYLVNSFADI
jgi:hypothetical protein